jgi:hypothetical protein
MLTRWCKQANLLQAQVKIGSQQSLSMGTGPAGQLVSVEDQLHAWMFEKREQGMALSITHIVWKAQKFLGPEFTAKSFNAKFCATKRWLKRFAGAQVCFNLLMLG